MIYIISQMIESESGVHLTDNFSEYPNDFDVNASLMSFIVHIWKEKSSSKKGDVVWRGHITAITDGRRQYFSEIKEIPTVLAKYIEVEK